MFVFCILSCSISASPTLPSPQPRTFLHVFGNSNGEPAYRAYASRTKENRLINVGASPGNVQHFAKYAQHSEILLFFAT